MDNVIIQKQNLTDIANAIRDKSNSTDTFTPSEMVEAINNIPTGREIEPIILTGDCANKCSGYFAGEYIKRFGDTVSTQDLTYVDSMFVNFEGDSVPFDLNFKANTKVDMNFIFSNSKIKELPKLNNLKIGALYAMFDNCHYLREIPEGYFDNVDFSAHKNTMFYNNQVFNHCYSLRKAPLEIYSNVYNKGGIDPCIYNKAFFYCQVLDDLIGIPIPYTVQAYTSNMFRNTFDWCNRLKDITFEADKVVQWKNQTIDLTQYVGYAPADAFLYDLTELYNSGLTTDKAVMDDASYQKNKYSNDWFALSPAYSRYDLNSAISTILSLPDASAYLATQASGTNTIKFPMNVGTATDNGSIDNLPEEIIALASSKGWTVSFIDMGY